MEELKREAQGCPPQGLCSHSNEEWGGRQQSQLQIPTLRLLGAGSQDTLLLQ